MLHTVNKSPFQNGTLESCLRFAQDGDTVLLLEDGVFAAKAGTAKSDMVSEAAGRVKLCALSADLKARGITSVVDGVQVVGYDTFVDLVDQNLMHAWL
ncbi:MAG: sulfurtransferase complex subunit TusB [Magnetococcus sp. WYHC-3]